MIDDEGFEYPDEPACAPQGAGARSAHPEAPGADAAPVAQHRTAAPERRAVDNPFAWHVSVSHAAKDWNVTPRRIRVLLAAGRLAGRVRTNGYWEVMFPYSFTFGTRGPNLKRQQRPPGKPKNPELKAV